MDKNTGCCAREPNQFLAPIGQSSLQLQSQWIQLPLMASVITEYVLYIGIYVVKILILTYLLQQSK